MADRDREVRDAAQAIYRLLRCNPQADPAVLAHECAMVLYELGWRHAVKPAPDWAHGGKGPDPDGPGGRALAEIKAKFEARSGHG
jgi:hypothetical protein